MNNWKYFFQNNKPFVLSGFVVLILSLNFWVDYLQNNMWINSIGFLLLAQILFINTSQKSIRLLIPSIICTGLFLISNIPFFAVACSYFIFCFLIEFHFGKLNNTVFFIIWLFAPFTRYIFNIFGFPIRIFLSKLSSQVLIFFNFSSQSMGNQITFNGNTFSVDSPCMGLRLVITGFLLTYLFFSIFEQRKQQELKNTYKFSMLVLSFLLIICANLARILGLILLNSAPETLSHELTGLVTLFLVHCFPLYFIIKKGHVKYFKNIETQNTTFTIPKYLFLIPFLLIGVLQSKPLFFHKKITQAYVTPLLTGYTTQQEKFNILQLKNHNSLLYFKPQHAFSISNHNPLICWKGTGYQVHNEQQIEINNVKLYTAVLVNGQEVLHTAWWYDDGQNIKTTNEFLWRYLQLKNDKKFHLINISCRTHEELLQEVFYLTQQQLFK